MALFLFLRSTCWRVKREDIFEGRRLNLGCSIILCFFVVLGRDCDDSKGNHIPSVKSFGSSDMARDRQIDTLRFLKFLSPAPFGTRRSLKDRSGVYLEILGFHVLSWESPVR